MVFYPFVVIFLSGVFIFVSACVSDVWDGSATFLGRRIISTGAGDVASLMGVRGVTSPLSNWYQSKVSSIPIRSRPKVIRSDDFRVAS